MTTDRLAYLLERYLGNTATPEELQEYNDWYEQQAGAAKGEMFEEGDTAQEYSRALFADIMDKIEAHEKETGTGRKTGKRYMLYIKWAAAAMVVGAMFLLYNSIRIQPGTTLAQKEVVRDTLQPETVTIENRTGEKKQFRLKDGSVAELFAGSKLRYTDPFPVKERKVYLSGKGFFNVARDPSRPFTVYSHDIATTALGTSFTITAYPGKNDVTISLHTGKVVVKHVAADGRPDRKEIYLLPGQQVSCQIMAGKAKFKQVTALDGKPVVTAGITPLGSRTGFTAAFEQAPLDSVLNIIAKGYGVPLQYDPLVMSEMLFSGRIRETDSLSQVLKRIAVLYDLSVKPSGKKYIIRKSH